MSSATRPPDPHASEAEQETHNRILCYVCETDLTGREPAKNGEFTHSKSRKKSGDEGQKPGLVEINSEGTGFAGGGKNMAKREGVAFQC